MYIFLSTLKFVNYICFLYLYISFNFLIKSTCRLFEPIWHHSKVKLFLTFSIRLIYLIISVFASQDVDIYYYLSFYLTLSLFDLFVYTANAYPLPDNYIFDTHNQSSADAEF
jgi:hypothetical protein